MTRSQQNWVALGFAAAYLVCLLFLPFYRVIVVCMSGLVLMQYGYAVMYLPLVLSLVMMLASVVLDVKISIGVGAITFLVTFVLLIAGNSVLMNGNALAALAGTAINQSVGMGITSMIPVSAGVGCILCLVLSAGFVAVEILLNQPAKKTPTSSSSPIDEDFF